MLLIYILALVVVNNGFPSRLFLINSAVQCLWGSILSNFITLLSMKSVKSIKYCKT